MSVPGQGRRSVGPAWSAAPERSAVSGAPDRPRWPARRPNTGRLAGASCADLTRLTRGARTVLEVAELERPEHCPSAIAHPELRQNARGMVLYGALGGAERIGDFPVAVAAGHQSKDFEL